MSIKNAVLPIPLSSMLSSEVPVDYDTAINPDGLPESCQILRLTNDTSNDVTVSGDGLIDHEYLRAGTSLLIYAMYVKERAAFMKGGKIYLRGTAGQSGSIYLSGYYQSY